MARKLSEKKAMAPTTPLKCIAVDIEYSTGAQIPCENEVWKEDSYCEHHELIALAEAHAYHQT